jgi:hypothetical protein
MILLPTCWQKVGILSKGFLDHDGVIVELLFALNFINKYSFAYSQSIFCQTSQFNVYA